MKHSRLNLLPTMCLMVCLAVGYNAVAQEKGNEAISEFVGPSGYYFSARCNDGTTKIFNMGCNSNELFTFGDKGYLQYHCSAFFDTWYDSYFYFRQEGDKIFRYDAETSNEAVAFDFGLKAGDKFTDRNGEDFVVSAVTDTVVVQEFDKKEAGTFRKITIDGIDNPGLHDEWLEGIGSLRTGMLDYCDLRDNNLFPSYKVQLEKACLLTVHTGLMRIHMTVDEDFVKGCFAANTIPSEELYLYESQPYETSFEFEFVSDALHVVGLTDIPKYNYIYIICYPRNGEILLDYILIPFGAGVFGASPYGIDVWFSGFEKGTYFVKFPGCDDVEVVCDGSGTTTGIEDIMQRTRNGSQTPTYDLSGRRIASEPQHGIYIKDGRKYVK